MQSIDNAANNEEVLLSPAQEAPESPQPAKPVSEARLRANRENAKSSTGPSTDEGKARSSLNATRHGILSQVIHLPEEEMKTYDQFTGAYVASLAPVGEVEIQLAHTCADLQFRLHRLAAAEHNLLAIGHDENGGLWNTGHSESHTALTLAETFRRSKDPLATSTLYETRLSRRFLQTLKQLRQMQADRKTIEQQQLEQMYAIAQQHPESAGVLEPAHFGFVCSTRDWTYYRKRRLLSGLGIKRGNRPATPGEIREFITSAA